jgi:DNA-binding CsgD family transcriptional regulator
MTLKHLQIVDVSPSDWIHASEHTKDAFAAEALSGARRQAVNEVGAAIAHQLVEPLTALLLYLHEVKWLFTSAPDATLTSAQEVIKGALRETERVCAIMERIGSKFELPIDSESAVAHGREAITWWSRTSNSAGEPPSRPALDSHPCLTPREREVLNLISGGATNKEGALLLEISPRTFEAHRAQIMRKLGAKNAADLFRKMRIESR